LLARGPEAAAALDALIATLDPSALLGPCAAAFVAVPGSGSVTEGARVVSVRGSEGLVCGVVYEVVAASGQGQPATGFGFGASPRQGTGSKSQVTLRRSIDGTLLVDSDGRPKQFSAGGLALAGASLEATLLHLVVLLGWPLTTVSNLLARQPRSAAALDSLGRTPLGIAVKVDDASRSLVPSPPPFPAVFIVHTSSPLLLDDTWTTV